MTYFIDTHCHLYLDEFNADRDQVIKRALEAGIQYLFLPNIDASSIQDLASLSASYSDTCFPMMGLHPTSVKADYREQMGVIEMELRENPGKYCAVGEIGIDLYWDKTYRREQIDVFTRQLELAMELDLPVAIHTRNSMDVALEICEGRRTRDEGRGTITEDRKPTIENRQSTIGDRRGVFHCFSGNLKQAEEAVEMGYMLGIGGVVTFPNSGLQQVVKAVGLEHLLLETDAPFLAPVPFRGKRNEPGYIPYIAEKVAELKGVPVEEVAEVTSRGAIELFGIGGGDVRRGT